MYVAFSGCPIWVIAIMLGWCRTSHLGVGATWRTSWQAHLGNQVECRHQRLGFFFKAVHFTWLTRGHVFGVSLENTVKTKSSCLGSQSPGQVLPGHPQWPVVHQKILLSPSESVSLSPQHLELPPFSSSDTRFFIPCNPVCLLTAHSCLGKLAEDSSLPEHDSGRPEGRLPNSINGLTPHLEQGFQEGSAPFLSQCWTAPC